MSRGLTLLLMLGGLLAGIGGSAQAFLPTDQSTDLAIPKPGSERPPLWQEVALNPTQHPSAAAFEARAGGTWRYKWNAMTGTPHAIYGSGLQLSTTSVQTQSQAEDLARAFISEQRDLLKVDPAEMELHSVVNGLGKWGVIFTQVHNGVPVDESRVGLLITESGRLAYISSDWNPDIRLDTQPALTLQAATELAGRAVSFVAGRDTDRGGSLLILPVPQAETIGYRLVWRITQEVAQPYAIWTSYVDAHTGEIVWRRNEVNYVNVIGTTAGNVEDFGYCYGEQDRRLPNMRVNITGGSFGYSDLDGNFDIANGGSLPVTLTAQLDGRWINVNNQQGADASFSGNATPGVPFEIRWNDANSTDAERDAYLHGNRIHDLIKHYDPGFIPPDYRMSANVNIASTCNAYWNGSSVNFYQEGGGCANTGQMGDVIYHEYTHGLTQWIYGSNPDDVGEGNSDVGAMFIDGNPIVGEGFYIDNCTSGIRNAENDLRYPDDYTGQEIHYKGQIVSGFWWDAWKILLPVLGEQGTRDLLWSNWHFGRRSFEPITMPDQVETAFIMDDDDGDLTNGTPHYFAFCPAADHHGFTPPGPTAKVTIASDRIHNQVYDGNPDEVLAVITSIAGPIDPSTAKLRYQVDGGSVVETAMAPTGNPNEYSGTIPALPVGARIDYAMVARDVLGNGGAYPPSACAPDTPAGTETFYIATSVDEMEVASGWTVGAPGDNAVTGIWERVDPNGTAAQPEDDETPPPGVMCWVTGQCPPGCGLGDNDVDGGTTTLNSPVYDLSASTTAKVVYYRWYSNDTGAAPGTDYWVVDASNDGGATWVNVENTNVSAARWTPIEVNLNDLFGGHAGQVKFRFVASDLGDGSLVEAGVDDFLLFVDFTSDASAQGGLSGGGRFSLLPVRPNPFSGGTDITFEIPTSLPVTMRVHDVTGKLVRTLASNRAFDAGLHIVRWDGRDERGREAAAGVYYVRLATKGFTANRKMVVQR